MSNTDIAGKEHWDDIYGGLNINTVYQDEWKPQGYCELLLESLIIPIIEKYKPKSIMEIGCGNSVWLPYIVKKYGIPVYGIDYSEQGCKLLRDNLPFEYRKNIFCVDFFEEETIKVIPKVDFVFSLGVIEHFSNPEEVIKIFASFVSKHGILLTEVPNIQGANFWISKLYHPKTLDMHVKHTIESLGDLYGRANIQIIENKYLGEFTLSLVAWGNNPRFPKVDKYILKIVNLLISCERKRIVNKKSGPFIYIYGQV